METWTQVIIRKENKWMMVEGQKYGVQEVDASVDARCVAQGNR